MISIDKVDAWVDGHEGFRAVRYPDSVHGFWTIGYGTNLDAPGAESHCAAAGVDYNAVCAGQSITIEQAVGLRGQAVQHAMDVATCRIVGLMDMPENVQLAIVDMIYNMGLGRFNEFVHAIAALEARDWAAAAAAMVDSLWYRQVGVRGKDDVALVLSAA